MAGTPRKSRKKKAAPKKKAAKKKASRKSPKKKSAKKKQTFLNDDVKFDLVDDELETAIENYYNAVTDRVNATAAENEARNFGHDLLKAKNRRKYVSHNTFDDKDRRVGLALKPGAAESVKLIKVKKKEKKADA